jgi:hypothetical protein
VSCLPNRPNEPLFITQGVVVEGAGPPKATARTSASSAVPVVAIHARDHLLVRGPDQRAAVNVIAALPQTHRGIDGIGLYLPALRAASRSVDSALGGLAVYVTDQPNRRVVDVSRPEGRLMWALVGPMFDMALRIAAQEMGWTDQAEVRRLVDVATGPKQLLR